MLAWNFFMTPCRCPLAILASNSFLPALLLRLQFQTSAADLAAINPELSAGGVLSPGTQVKLPPA